MVTQAEIDRNKQLIAAEKLLIAAGFTILSKYNRMVFIAISAALIVIGLGTGFFLGFVFGHMR